MNERIRELYIQTSNETAEGKEWAIGGLRNAERFAELIIQECVDQMELVRKYRYDRIQPFENQQTIIDECQYQIKQHFGVEE